MQVTILKQVKDTIDISVLRIIFPTDRQVIHHPDGSFTTSEKYQQLDIDLETGAIKGWPHPHGSVYENIDTDGIYQLYSNNGILVAEVRYERPPQLVGDRGYLILNIIDGRIDPWHKLNTYSLPEFLEYFGMTVAN
jgi:hypothetical protein